MDSLANLAKVLRQLRRREARQRRGSQLTYREISAKTGWSRGIIGEYFAGKVLPPTDRFDLLINLLGATPAEQGQLATARDLIEENRRGAAHAAPGGAVHGLLKALSTKAEPPDASAWEPPIAISTGYRGLSCFAARLFRLISVHPGPDATLEALASLAGTPSSSLLPALNELVDAHLVFTPRPRHYAMPSSARPYATTLLHETDGAPAARAARFRMLGHYMHRSRHEPPGWFADEYPVLLSVMREAAAHGHTACAWHLVTALAVFLSME